MMLFNFSKKRFSLSFLIAVFLCAVYFSALIETPFFQSANLKTSDTVIRANKKIFPKKQAIQEKVIVLTIDDDSILKLRKSWPWPRSITAQAVDIISAGKPKAICFDAAFLGESDDPREDKALRDAMEESGKVFASTYFGKDGVHVIPYALFEDVLKGYGFVNKPRDIDGAIRRFRPYIELEGTGNIAIPLTAKLVSFLTGERPNDIVQPFLSRGKQTAPLFYSSSFDDVENISIWNIFVEDFNPSLFENKIVFVGATSEIFHDSYMTPLGYIPGVYILVNEMRMFLNKTYITFFNRKAQIVIFILFCFIALYASISFMPIWAFLIIILETLILFLISLFLYKDNKIYFFFGPIITISISVIPIILFKYISLMIDNLALKNESILDELTSLYTYKYLSLQLKQLFPKIKKKGTSLTAVFFDLDEFKQINDLHGHEFGNKVLATVATIIKNSTRSHDIVARYGGEEFCIVLKDVETETAFKYANRIRVRVKDTKFIATKNDDPVTVTISGGIASTNMKEFKEWNALIAAADEALYVSKNTGRNKISLYAE